MVQPKDIPEISHLSLVQVCYGRWQYSDLDILESEDVRSGGTKPIPALAFRNFSSAFIYSKTGAMKRKFVVNRLEHLGFPCVEGKVGLRSDR